MLGGYLWMAGLSLLLIMLVWWVLVRPPSAHSPMAHSGASGFGPEWECHHAEEAADPVCVRRVRANDPDAKPAFEPLPPLRGF